MKPDTELTRAARKKGLSLTRQRRAVIGALTSAESHPTATQVFDAVRSRMPTVTLATVYRNLNTLAELGLVRELHSCSGGARFDVITDDHCHLSCLECGRMDDLRMGILADLTSQAQSATQYVIKGHCLVFQGTCPQCRRSVAGNNHDGRG